MRETSSLSIPWYTSCRPHEPLKSIIDADHFASAITRFQGNGSDDAVDAGRRSAPTRTPTAALGVAEGSDCFCMIEPVALQFYF